MLALYVLHEGLAFMTKVKECDYLCIIQNYTVLYVMGKMTEHKDYSCPWWGVKGQRTHKQRTCSLTRAAVASGEKAPILVTGEEAKICLPITGDTDY